MFHYQPSLDKIILDEISLEGLEGITIEGLWVRFRERLEVEGPLPDPMCNEVWNIARRLNDICLYELPVERLPYVVYDRYKYVDEELGFVYEPPDATPSMYTYCPIDDKVNQIQGSCTTYTTRIDVTTEARQYTLNQAQERWGRKLVLVSSQKARMYSMTSGIVSPILDWNVIQFCILERIARSRYMGEITQGKISLQEMGIEPKTLFYHRKTLLKHKLIIKQVHHQKFKMQNCSGSLLHIPRFYVERKPKSCFLTEKVVDILRTKPGYIAEYDEIKNELGSQNSLKKLFKTPEFQRFVKTDLRVPYRGLYPNAERAEWKQKGNDKEKTIRVIQLIDPNVDVLEIWSRDDDLDQNDDKGFLDCSKEQMDRSKIAQALEAVEAAGPQGITQVELAQQLGQGKLNARTLCRHLLRLKLIFWIMNDVGRQRVARYISCQFVEEGQISVQFNRERSKMIELYSTTNQERSRSSSSLSGPIIGQETSQDNVIAKADEKTEIGNSTVHIPPTESVISGLKNQNIVTTVNSNIINRDVDQIEIKVVETSSVPGLRNCSVGLMETLNNIDKNKDDIPRGVTYRLLKRANTIIETVRADTVIHDLTKLMKMIQEEEMKEGYSVKIDKKSLLRLLMKLTKDGYLKTIRITLSANNKSKVMIFICEPHITTDHTIIQSAIEQGKMKFFIVGKERIMKMPQSTLNGEGDADFNAESIYESIHELQSFGKSKKLVKTNLIYNPKMGKRYGFCPKFMRMKTLHMFLFHVIYCHPGDPLNQDDAIESFRSQGVTIDDELKAQISPIYTTDMTWKMFVPPLPHHNGWEQGWTIMCDILLRLPLSIYLRVFNVSYVIPHLEEYIKHPIKRHFLVKYIPSDMRNQLLMARRYIFSIHETVSRLCYVGILQFGPQKLKEKDQVFLYLNKNASLYDTTSSEAGYHMTTVKQYPKYSYTFTCLEDIDKYWHDMWNISIHTRLGNRVVVTGQEIVLEDLFNKPDMLNAISARASTEAPLLDKGDIPGDSRGAAGLDSAMFVHIKRNWNWSNCTAIVQDDNLIKSQRPNSPDGLRKKKLNEIKQKSYLYKDLPTIRKSTKPAYGETNKHPKPKQTKTAASAVGMSAVKSVRGSKRKIVRQVLPRKKDKRRPYYDEIDKQALEKMSKLRVDWLEHEDKLLLLCKVGLMYLFSNPRKVVIGFHILRDILHHGSNSFNKTSRACQRRILYTMKSSNTLRSVRLCLQEVHRCTEIAEKYGEDFVSKLKIQYPDRKEFLNQLSIHFVELVMFLRKKFYKLTSNTNEFMGYLPDTVEGFHNLYVYKKKRIQNQRLKFADPTCVTDIQSAVVKSVIHSSLCCVKDKTRWTYQLFNIYKQYPDNMLRNIMAKLRLNQMVSMKKTYVKSARAGNLPLSSAHFQLSITYENQMKNRFPPNLFTETYDMLKNFALFVNENGADPRGIHIHTTNGGTAAGLTEYTFNREIKFTLEIPEQVVILDPRINKSDPTYNRIKKRYLMILQNLPENLKKFEQSNDSEEEEESDDASDKKKMKIEITSASSSTEEPVASELSIHNPHSKVALYMIREDMSGHKGESPQHLHDFFVVKSANVYAHFVQKQLSTLELEEPKTQLLGKLAVPTGIIPTDPGVGVKVMNQVEQGIKKKEPVRELAKDLEERVCEFGKKQDLKFAYQLISFIEEHKEVGVTGVSLKESFELDISSTCTIPLHRLLDILVEKAVVSRVGVNTVHYVHHKYLNCWLVRTYCLRRLEREKIPPSTNPALVVGRLKRRRLSSIDEDNNIPTSKIKLDCNLEDGVRQNKNEETITEENGNLSASLIDAACTTSTNEKGGKKMDRKEQSTNIDNTERAPTFDQLGISDPNSIKGSEEHSGTDQATQISKMDPDFAHVWTKIASLLTRVKSLPTVFESPLKRFCADRWSGDSLPVGNDFTLVSKDAIFVQTCAKSGSIFDICVAWSVDALYIHIAPWVRVDGTVNYRVLDHWLGTILSYCISNPGVTLARTAEKYVFVLPFHVRWLVEVLAKLECVRLIIVKRSEINLFTSVSKVELVPATGLEHEADITILPEDHSIIKFSLFLGERSYKSTFLQRPT